MSQCEACGNSIEPGQLYTQVYRAVPQTMTVEQVMHLVDTAHIEKYAHLQCPRTYIPPAVNPMLVLRCTRCQCTAHQHGFRFNPQDGSVTYGWPASSGSTQCEVCLDQCPEFEQAMPAMPSTEELIKTFGT